MCNFRFSFFELQVLTENADISLKTPELSGAQLLGSSSLLRFRFYRYSNIAINLFEQQPAFSHAKCEPSLKSVRHFMECFIPVISHVRGGTSSRCLDSARFPFAATGTLGKHYLFAFLFSPAIFLSASPDTPRAYEDDVFSYGPEQALKGLFLEV